MIVDIPTNTVRRYYSYSPNVDAKCSTLQMDTPMHSDNPPPAYESAISGTSAGAPFHLFFLTILTNYQRRHPRT